MTKYWTAKQFGVKKNVNKKLWSKTPLNFLVKLH